MESNCAQLLRDFGFEKYIPQFEAALFNDIESLEALVSQPNLLAQMIGPLGQRAKFVAKMEKFISEQKEEAATDVKKEMPDENLIPAVRGLDSSFTAAELAELLENQPVIKVESSNAEREESNAFEEPPAKRIRTSNDVLELLQLTVDGKYLLGLYAIKGFDNKNRVRLANCIINAEYGADANKVIGTARFKELARQINEVFPDEEETTYYVPAYTPRGGKTVIARGKLYDKYTALNKELREANLRKKRPTQSEDIEPNNLIPENNEGNTDMEVCLKFLETCLKPWDLIVDYWKRTSAYRLNSLLNDIAPKANVESYLQRYACLKQPKGYTLLEIDFKNRFTEGSLRLFSHWGSFSDKVKRELATTGVHKFESDVDLIQKFVQLFSICPVKVPKGKAWRASRADIQQGCMLHIKVMSDFEKEIEKINALATEKGFSVQPFPLVVGMTLKDINSSYVVIDGQPILVESPLRALEVAFKCYFALHCEYPIQSQRQWTVLQKTLFGVHVPYDRINPIANLPEVKRLIKKLQC
ncbi:uncharacterized protein LOC117182197 [Belonocnema kinseyi]|uniref:uncharacterized protein LOC117182197 n=1 Tax=Belonocnema kinseyi TaxID=2817044 RepID=UPI00143DC506|nr:uncharacterized protein LOC117182197 [Belonocnema kinseyi]